MTAKIKIIATTLALAVIVFITSCAKTPEACFVADKGKNAKLNEEVQFDAACSKDANTYVWDFGDGTTGSGASTKHKYTVVGVYIVKLTASNDSKEATYSIDLTIEP